MKKDSLLPELPLQEWENTKMTLHLILQIMGKVRLKRTLRKNHWWFIDRHVLSCLVQTLKMAQIP